jgi:transposase-like protein
MLRVVEKPGTREEGDERQDLDELAREGARQMLMKALEAERGLSTGDFRPALEGLPGKDAAGLSATNITRLTAEWDEEYQLFRTSSLAERDYVYVWVDGIHFNVRLRRTGCARW